MFAANFYVGCFVSRGNSIKKKLIRPGWKKVVCQPLFMLANTLVGLMRSAVDSLNWLNINLWMSK